MMVWNRSWMDRQLILIVTSMTNLLMVRGSCCRSGCYRACHQ
ncbi:hypothetical protein BVRB_023150 [Beta vulgaris subsp. vulgaris]|uniref:Uncharacterized protein n=1 Tax=Beta vulgaris subsp. vulgaris TaxID=3555 RepID=A0A0J8DTZ0_BETVV|nr:hypothetical protein BVRB_023150 [Beta vulgaris subsp. vulgaris]